MSTSDEATEAAWRIYSIIGDWTARVDAKASFALTLESASAAGIIALSANGGLFAHPHGWGPRVLLWLGTVLVLASAAFAALVVVPRLHPSRARAEAPDNFIYFGHLMHREATELAASLQQTPLLPVLSRQLVIMSRITWTKHRHVQISFALFALGALLVFIAGVTV